VQRVQQGRKDYKGRLVLPCVLQIPHVVSAHPDQAARRVRPVHRVNRDSKEIKAIRVPRDHKE
jgi:hypothetical protein